MTKDSVPQAERPNLAETRAERDGDRGGRPIRKRGYHRALKRREPWAVSQKAMADVMSATCRMFASRLYDHVWTDNAKLIGLKGTLGD